MACTEFSSDNNFYIKSWNLIALFHFENHQVFLPHPVYHGIIIAEYNRTDVSLEHICDWMSYCTQHSDMDAPHYMPIDVPSK